MNLLRLLVGLAALFCAVVVEEVLGLRLELLLVGGGGRLQTLPGAGRHHVAALLFVDLDQLHRDLFAVLVVAAWGG